MAERDKTTDEEWGRFTCPKCGSHCWGSSDYGREHQCNGFIEAENRCCGFTWSDVDSPKYGLKSSGPPYGDEIGGSDVYAVALERTLRDRNALRDQVTHLQAECTRLEEARRVLGAKLMGREHGAGIDVLRLPVEYMVRAMARSVCKSTPTDEEIWRESNELRVKDGVRLVHLPTWVQCTADDLDEARALLAAAVRAHYAERWCGPPLPPDQPVPAPAGTESSGPPPSDLRAVNAVPPSRSQ